MNKKILLVLGIGAIVLAYVLNLNYAADNYGIKTNSLSFSVLAQSGSSGGSSGSGSGGSSYPAPKVKFCRPVECIGLWTATADIDGCISWFFGPICKKFQAFVVVTFNYSGTKENCTGGSDWEDCDACQQDCVPKAGFNPFP